MDPQLILLLVLLFLSAFFCGTEIAIISVSYGKIRALAEKGNSTAKIIEKIKQHPHKFLITILVGNNLVNIAAPVLTTVWATEKFGSEILGVVTGVLTVIMIIFTEMFPKVLADHFSLRWSLIVARPVWYLQIILFPVVWILELIMKGLMRFTGEKTDKITADEIKAMLYFGAEKGAIEQEEHEIIENILDFADTRVEQIMTPREHIIALEQNALIDAAITIMTEEGKSRLPVYDKELDTIVGVLTIQELLRAKRNRDAKTPVKELDLNPPILVPESKLLNDLFKEFQWKHQHMAIVVNEHGSVSGLATMEDLLEEIVGEIVDESDEDELLIEKLSETSWRVNAEVTVEELNDTLETEFDCDDHKPVSYLLLEKFQKIPRRGEDILIQGFHFFIEKMAGNKIEFVRVVKTAQLES